MRWRLPQFRTSLRSPYGDHAAAPSDGAFVGRSAVEDDWFRSQGALPLVPENKFFRLMRFVLKALAPQASPASAGTFVFLRDLLGGWLHFDTGESLVPVCPPMDVMRPWSPHLLEGLVDGWIAGDLVLANNTAVSGWVGIKGLTLIQTSGAKQPIYYSTDAAHTINGHPAVYFDGTNDLLACTAAEAANFANYDTHCIIAVVRPTPTASAEGALFSSCDDGGANTWLWVGADNSASNKFVFHQKNSGDTEDVIAGGVISSGAVQTVEWTSDGAAQYQRVKHADQALTVANGANNGDSFADTVGRDNVAIGGRSLAGNESRPWKGDVAMLLVLTHITPPERAKLFAWIAANYATGL